MDSMGFHADIIWFPHGHAVGHHVVSMWTQCGYYVDTMWFPGRHHMVFKWTPHGFHVDTMWFPGGN